MNTRVSLAATSLAALVVLGVTPRADAQFYQQHDLVSDGTVPADLVDPDLVNAWGLAASATGPWWVANNGTDTSTLYNGSGGKLGLVVHVPGAPTGVVFNGTAGFLVGAPSGPARFIFATEEGTIRGWRSGTQTDVGVDHSGEAIYKGLALATTPAGSFLYAANFHAGRVEVYDSSWKDVTIPGRFVDSDIPAGYAPFGIHNIRGTIFVTYALQDENAEDDVPGPGHGFVDAYDTEGRLIRRVASREELNSPWGVALAPDDFGKFSGHLLIGNFGDGRIHAFDPTKFRGDGRYQKRGPLHSADGRPIQIAGLWAIEFGNGGSAGPVSTLYFTAGPFDEAHGLFGSLTAVAPSER
jgi:uncharacterized protein (TIGR03118 family)